MAAIPEVDGDIGGSGDDAAEIDPLPNLILTGATRGIGAATLPLVAARFNIIAPVRTPEGVEAVGMRLEELGNDGEASLLDLSQPDTIEEWFGGVVDRRESVHTLLNIAGWVKDDVMTTPKDDDRIASIIRMGNVNFIAPQVLTQLAIPFVRAAKGSIVNVTSLSGHTTNPSQSAYSAAKRGIDQFSMFAAVEPGRVRMNSLALGFVDTDMTNEVPAKHVQMFLDAAGWERPLTAEEAAEAVVTVMDADIRGRIVHYSGTSLDRLPENRRHVSTDTQNMQYAELITSEGDDDNTDGEPDTNPGGPSEPVRSAFF